MIWRKVAIYARLEDVHCGSGVKTVAMQNSAISCMSSVAPISWAVCIYLHTFREGLSAF